MSSQIIDSDSDLVVELSTNEQQLFNGGFRRAPITGIGGTGVQVNGGFVPGRILGVGLVSY